MLVLRREFEVRISYTLLIAYQITYTFNFLLENLKEIKHFVQREIVRNKKDRASEVVKC